MYSCALPFLLAKNGEYAVTSVKMGLHSTLFAKQAPEVGFHQEMIPSK